ncbi:MAG TPA: hypothetical protein VHW24_24020, partial [Bryobacteraceae bacterium]|nr:hypothetical protein [Bryobacteraceae bacterium]
MQRADDQYSKGPESLVRQSKAIVAGPVSNLKERVLDHDASSGTPLRWEVSGVLTTPRVLKGEPGMPMPFQRVEQLLLIGDDEHEYWEADFLRWRDGDSAVVFFNDAAGTEGRRVLPSGSGERDLAAVVETVVGIDGLSDRDRQFQAWAGLVRTGANAIEKRAALRSALGFHRPWEAVAPILREALEDSEMREFGFGLVGYGIRTHQWADPMPATELLCDEFANESDERAVSDDLASLGLLL